MNLEFNKYSTLEELRSATHSEQSAAGNYAAQPCFSVDLTRDPPSVCGTVERGWWRPGAQPLDCVSSQSKYICSIEV